MGFDFAGTYTNIVKHKLIVYSFGDRVAQVELADSPKGVRVRVAFDSERAHSIEQQREGWQAILRKSGLRWAATASPSPVPQVAHVLLLLSTRR